MAFDASHARTIRRAVPDRVGEDDEAALALLEVLGSLASGPHGGTRGTTTKQTWTRTRRQKMLK